MIVTYICIFFIGASVASFLNATLYRIEKKYKYPEIIFKGSHCEKCKHELSWWELIPVFGYLFLKGKCKMCNHKISLYSPLSEMSLGLIFLSFFLLHILWPFWIIVILLFVLSSHDIKYMNIPANIVHLLLIFSAIYFCIFSFNLVNLVLPISISVLFLLVNRIKKSFGFGDILVLFGLGILLNYQEYLVMFWIGIVIALLYSLIVIIVKKTKMKDAKIPMIPFFTLSFSLSLIYGEEIYNFLLKYIGMW